VPEGLNPFRARVPPKATAANYDPWTLNLESMGIDQYLRLW